MKISALGVSALAVLLSAGAALAGGGYDRGPMPKSKTFYYAASSNKVSAGQVYGYKSKGCGCKGEVTAFSVKEHNDYAKKTQHGVEAGGYGLSQNTITWKNAGVIGAGYTHASGSSAAAIGGSSMSGGMAPKPTRR